VLKMLEQSCSLQHNWNQTSTTVDTRHQGAVFELGASTCASLCKAEFAFSEGPGGAAKMTDGGGR
jgi:hypothetical protein